MRPVGGTGCATVLPELGELALGISTGEERARALDHLDDCASCAAELVALSAVADQLTSAAPEADPTVDFAPGVLARIAGSRTQARTPGADATSPAERPKSGRSTVRRRRRALAAVAACAVALGVALFAGLARGPGGAAHASGSGAVTGNGARSATLVSAGVDVGAVVAYAGIEPSLLVTVRGVPAGSSVVCDVTTDAGKTVRLGSFWLGSGHGSWAAGLPVEPRALRSAEVTTAGGVVLARATFRRS